MTPYMLVGKLAPNSSHLTRRLVKYVPGRDYFRAFPSQNGDKFVTSQPPPQSLNGSTVHYRLTNVPGDKEVRARDNNFTVNQCNEEV